MSELEKRQDWANLLKTYKCDQLARGLRRGIGMGSQVESSGSLNGFQLDNPYEQAIHALVGGGLEGAGFEVARRTTDIAFNAVRLEVDLGERDRLAFLLHEGKIRP